jgi:hypothetical protein
VKSTFWPYKGDPYEIFKLLIEDPRMPKTRMTRRLKVNPNTFASWWNATINKRIIILPVFRRKSFLNFREYFYFLETRDPHKLYKLLQVKNLPIDYFNVQTGFCNFQIISLEPIEPEGKVILSGPRSDYLVTIPPNRSFTVSIKKINTILGNLDNLEYRSSPLKFRNEKYLPWDEKDETIFWAMCNDVRIPFASVVKKAETYNDKAWSWFRNRDKFGDTITMFFPKGEGAYILSLYIIDTEYDSVLIDIFSELPASTLFYRINDKVVMGAYLPFSIEGRSVVRNALSILQKEELVESYTNSVVEYGFRP